MNDVFLDASYAIALSSPGDENHVRAVELARDLESAGTRLVTTHAVLLEVGNFLAKARYRSDALRLLASLQNDPKVEIVGISAALFRQAFDFYGQRMDKEWGLTDCVSFVLMHERGISEALTADRHFQQAGFRALLVQPDTDSFQGRA